ncbi:unnamed protein product [Adineta steineri]|uniref:EGF-like domain-containing protein n=2 Tax=Adineta steineri TaxID=433720 RepID=A0A814M6Y8_9BILA|nr:unnamed protein product [Adineta steineri]
MDLKSELLQQLQQASVEQNKTETKSTYHQKTSDGVAVCNDTANWNNSAQHSCDEYQFTYSWCVNGYFQPSTYWTGGSRFRYPEFNCCDCGKGWPVWFVPNTGYEATKAVPELTDNDGNSNVTDLKCIDPMGNSGVCNMACKMWSHPVISLTTITNNNFDLYNCTLSLQTTNASMSYTLQIPQNNYIVYFTNWTTDDYNFSCLGTTPPPNSSMLCRHDVAQCLPPATAYRCVSPGTYFQLRKTTINESALYLDCIGTSNWISNNTASRITVAYTCNSYEVDPQWCSGGTATPGNQWALGSMYNFPEFNCCGCGKGWPLWFVPLAGFAATKVLPELMNNTQNSNVTHLQCIDSYGNSRACNMTCKLWTNPLTSIETITTNNFDLFNCTLIIRTMNESMSYIIQIPSDNYLVYFSNWTTSDYDFACEGNQALPNVSMLCRHDFIQCLSTEVTNRYVPPENTQFTTLQPTSLEVDGQLFSSLEPIVDQDTSETPTTNTLLSPVESSSFKAMTYAEETTTTVSPIGSSSFKATTYAQEITTTALIAFVTAATLPPSPVWQSPTCANGNIGLNCNVTVDLCQITNPCLNNGTCVNTLSSSYTCTCMQGFTGSHCETDIRPCKPWTCLSYGLCNETSPTTFQCECYPGYEGLNCESVTDYCDDIVCQNNGQCRPILLNFTCESLITTTSIHGKSIQYDRLKQLKFIGYTKGFGTSHISASFMDKVREYLKVNNPEVLTRKQSKWQLLKFVAQKLNIDSSQLFYHGDQRGIYYGWTGTNANEFLLKTKMNFVQDKLQSVESTASFWKQRWAKQRATHLNKSQL